MKKAEKATRKFIRDVVREARKLKKKEKLTVKLGNTTFDEIAETAQTLQDKGFVTCISSGILTVQKGSK